MPHRMDSRDSQGCGLHLWEISRHSGGVLRRHHGRTVCRSSLRAETRKQGLAIDSRKSSCDPLCDSGRARRAGGRCLVAQSLLLSCGSDDGVCRDVGAVRGWPEAGVVGDRLWRYLDSCLRWRLLFFPAEYYIGHIRVFACARGMFRALGWRWRDQAPKHALTFLR